MNNYIRQNYPEAVSAYYSFLECYDNELIEWEQLSNKEKKVWIYISNTVLETYAGNFDQINIKSKNNLQLIHPYKKQILKIFLIIIYILIIFGLVLIINSKYMINLI